MIVTTSVYPPCSTNTPPTELPSPDTKIGPSDKPCFDPRNDTTKDSINDQSDKKEYKKSINPFES